MRGTRETAMYSNAGEAAPYLLLYLILSMGCVEPPWSDPDGYGTAVGHARYAEYTVIDSLITASDTLEGNFPLRINQFHFGLDTAAWRDDTARVLLAPFFTYRVSANGGESGFDELRLSATSILLCGMRFDYDLERDGAHFRMDPAGPEEISFSGQVRNDTLYIPFLVETHDRIVFAFSGVPSIDSIIEKRKEVYRRSNFRSYADSQDPITPITSGYSDAVRYTCGFLIFPFTPDGSSPFRSRME